jgi:hypothetical protein
MSISKYYVNGWWNPNIWWQYDGGYPFYQWYPYIYEHDDMYTIEKYGNVNNFTGLFVLFVIVSFIVMLVYNIGKSKK